MMKGRLSKFVNILINNLLVQMIVMTERFFDFKVTVNIFDFNQF